MNKVYLIFKEDHETGDPHIVFATLDPIKVGNKLEELNADFHEANKLKQEYANKLEKIAEELGFTEKWRVGQEKWKELMDKLPNDWDSDAYDKMSNEWKQGGYTSEAYDDIEWLSYVNNNVETPPESTACFHFIEVHTLS